LSWLPPGKTEEEVLAVIDKVVDVLAPQFVVAEILGQEQT
jgi:hypothetical protein